MWSETTHPREGTEIKAEIFTINYDSKQLIPARGRKYLAYHSRNDRKPKQLIPARGRKCNHLKIVLNTVLKQLIPARGRKQEWEANRPGDYETTHPREGTETLYNFAMIFTFSETTHPREGTETEYWRNPAILHSKQLIPARGRKPEALEIDERWMHRNNSSPRGDKTRLTKVRSANIIKALHPREGTENLPGDGIR